MTLASNLNKSQQSQFRVLFIPIMIEQFFGLLLSNIDVLMLSQYSDEAVAAVGISNQLVNIAFMLSGIITIGASILLYQMNEDKHSFQIYAVIHHVFYLTLWLSAIVAIVFLFFGKSLLGLMQTPQELINGSYQFLTIIGISLIFQSMVTSLSTVLRSFAYTKLVMYVSVLMNILNVVGNYFVLNTSFHLLGEGIVGVASSTLIARIIGSLIIIVFFIRYLTPYRTALTKIKSTSSTTFSILKLGFPSAMENISYNISQTIITAVIATFGAVMVTTKVYVSTISLIIFAVAASLSTVNQIIIGKMIGRNEKDDAARYTIKVLISSFLVSISMAFVIASCSDWIIRLFTDNSEIIYMVKTLLWMSCLLEPARSLNEVLVGAINVAGSVKYPTYLNIIVTYIFVVPVCLVVGKYLNLGLVGIWMIFIIDECLRAMILLMYWKRGKWKKIKVIQN